MKKMNTVIRVLVLCLSILVVISVLPMSASASPAVIFSDEDPVPINPNANQTCKNFYQYLWNLRKTDKVVSGAQSLQVAGGNNFNIVSPEGDNHKFIQETFGVTPVIFGSMDEIVGRTDSGYISELYKRYQQGAVPMAGYEPTYYREAYKAGKQMDDWIVNLDKTNPNRDMNMYNSYFRELEIEADGFELMEEAGIEVYLYRFFGEINNTSRRGFYGASKEGYEACHRVWQQAVEYLTVERGLTGILFVYCAAGFTTSDEFYPGDDYVDIIGPTAYSNRGNGEIFEDETYADYQWTKKIKKVFGFTEIAPRSFSAHDIPDAIGDYKKLVDSVLYMYPEASFANTWYCDCHSLVQPGKLDNAGNYNGQYYLNSPNVLFADDMPDYKSSTPIKSNGITQFYSGNKEIGNLPLGKFNSKELKNRGITISSIDSLDIVHGTAVLAYASSDCSGKATILYGSNQKLTNDFKKAKSLEIVKLENLAFEKNIWVEDSDVSAINLNDGINYFWEIDQDNNGGQISIIIDLGKEYNIGQMSVNHAGFYEDFKYNVRDFEIQVSSDNSEYKTVYKNYGNVYPASDFWFNPVNARYVKLHVITPNSSTSEIEKNRISIAEIEVFGVDSGNISLNNVSSQVIIEENKSVVNQTTDIQSNQNSNVNVQENQNDASVAADETDDNPIPKLPEIVIPKFYSYVWLIIAGGIIFLAGGVSLTLLLINKKRMKAI